MNIKILNPIPEDEVLVTLPFGSQVYGTANDHSDKDYVKILKQDCGVLLLQYQSDSQALEHQVDYVYTDINNFKAKVADGGNTVFFEAMHTPEFEKWWNTRYESFGYDGDIKEYLLNYYTSRMAKGYLGLAKRDLDYGLERIHHVNRGIWLAEQIIQENLINLSDIQHVPEGPRMTKNEYLEVIKEMRSGLVYV